MDAFQVMDCIMTFIPILNPASLFTFRKIITTPPGFKVTQIRIIIG
jgi:hypothetical protein